MRVRRVTVQQFRNLAQVDLHLRGRQQFLVGANGQGKTNLLEAIGFITALRSFRTLDHRVLIAHGQAEATLACEVEHELRGDTRVAVRLRPAGKELRVDQERVSRLADHLGHFPTVVFSSQDQQLVRGAPSGRRRWLDLTLAATDSGYLQALQQYHRALAGRNALLKRGGPTGELAAFERPLAAAGIEVMSRRQAGLQRLGVSLLAAYACLVPVPEEAGFAYVPAVNAASADALSALWERQRARDQQARTTLAGPHRDDFDFTLAGRPAREFASEGQQRSLVLALRLAQVAFFQVHRGVRPVVLADDVLGELDPERRRRFWGAVGEGCQVIASGTSLPDAVLGDWQILTVEAGRVTEAAGGGQGA